MSPERRLQARIDRLQRIAINALTAVIVVGVTLSLTFWFLIEWTNP